MTIEQRPSTEALQPVTSRQLDWLTGQVRGWQADGVVDDATAAAVLGRYRVVRRLKLGAMLLYLGGAFIGVGLIWLVAANLDAIAPLPRFLLITTFWLALVGAAHVLSERRRSRGLTRPSPVLGSLQGAAALAYGGVIFQAAQSLQVPAYEPELVGLWSAGTLLYAYLVRGLAPLAVGVVTGFVWFLWETLIPDPSGLGVVLTMLLAANVLLGVAALHRFLDLPRFGIVWRDLGALLLLIGFFVAAFPGVTDANFEAGPEIYLAATVALVLALAAAGLRGDTSALDPAAALGVTVIGVLLVLWDPGTDTSDVGTEDWLHAVVSVAAYVALAAWIAAIGIMRDSERLTWVALAALVVFTTAQAFAVFAPIVDGAWLFMVVGAVLVGSGWLFDRGRRELEASLDASVEGAAA